LWTYVDFNVGSLREKLTEESMAKLLNPREEEGDRCPLFGEGDSVFAIIKATEVSIEKEASAGN